MKTGFYYKLDDKWYRSGYNDFSVNIVRKLTECYHYNERHKIWKYSDYKYVGDDYFSRWQEREPCKEDILVLELMFP